MEGLSEEVLKKCLAEAKAGKIHTFRLLSGMLTTGSQDDKKAEEARDCPGWYRFRMLARLPKPGISQTVCFVKLAPCQVLGNIKGFQMKPKEVKAYLDRYIIEQDDAKRVLSVALCDHYNWARRCLDDPSLRAKNYTKPHLCFRIWLTSVNNGSVRFHLTLF